MEEVKEAVKLMQAFFLEKDPDENWIKILKKGLEKVGKK